LEALAMIWIDAAGKRRGFPTKVAVQKLLLCGVMVRGTVPRRKLKLVMVVERG
jgi:hypothetical protein